MVRDLLLGRHLLLLVLSAELGASSGGVVL